MASLFFSIAALALLNAGRLTICKVARVVTQRVVGRACGARKAARVRCTFAA